MENKEIKLNLGSGNSKKTKDAGYINIDIHKMDYVDVVHDIEKRLPYENDSINEIFCSHALEHCSMAVVPVMIKDWKRVLKQSGIIRVIVPEIEACMRNFLKAPENEKWGFRIEYILGAQHHQTGQQFHKSAFTQIYLKKLVEDAGLVVTSIKIQNNGRNDCIHLIAHKP